MQEFQELKDKKILVTGGAGFIGSNLCNVLIKIGAKVICLDNFITGKWENIEAFLDNPNFFLIEGDITDSIVCSEVVKGVDFILHEAAIGSVPRSIEDPVNTNNSNISGFVNILTAAKNASVKRFVYASSSSVYGDSTELPKIEHQVGKPLSPYAVTKYVNELYAEIFHKTYGIDSIGLRYFNVYGANQDPESVYAAVIPKFVTQLMNYSSPLINGDGTYSRDFTYISDIVQINLLCLITEKKAALNQVYNAAFGGSTTLRQLVDIVKEYLSEYDPKVSKIPISFGPHRAGDIPHSLASIVKARNLLNYNPRFNIRDGIKEALNWYWHRYKQREII